MDSFKRYLRLSQQHLFLWLILSSALVSSVVLQNGGVSNYGNHFPSVIPYTLAFVVSAVYIFLAARELQKMGGQFDALVIYLRILGALLLLVYVTTFPRRFGDVYSDIHDNISKGLFIYELLLATWLMAKKHTLETLLYFTIMFVGSLIGLLSSLHIVRLMFVGQMVGELGFALLLVRTLPKIVTDMSSKKPKTSN